MKKKTKHKKQKAVTHPTSESERIGNLMRTVSNPGEHPELKYDTMPRKLRIPSDAGETSDIRIDARDIHDG